MARGKRMDHSSRPEGQVEADGKVHYYISSRPVDTKVLLTIVRGHWRGPSGWKNGLHRALDMQFREDDDRRRGHAPTVTGILRRAALNRVCMIQQKSGPDWSIGSRSNPIGRNPALLASLLA